MYTRVFLTLEPLGLELVAGAARAVGHDVRIVDLLAFFADRLKVYLRDKGARHDLIDAVFALPGQDDLVMITRRVGALVLYRAFRHGSPRLWRVGAFLGLWLMPQGASGEARRT